MCNGLVLNSTIFVRSCAASSNGELRSIIGARVSVPKAVCAIKWVNRTSCQPSPKLDGPSTPSPSVQFDERYESCKSRPGAACDAATDEVQSGWSGDPFQEVAHDGEDV